MKIITTEIAGSGKERILFALGREEMKILFAVLDQMLKHTPQLPETEILRRRANSMRREIHEALHPRNRAKPPTAPSESA